MVCNIYSSSQRLFHINNQLLIGILCLLSLPIHAQYKNIEGFVTDQKGLPLQFVTITPQGVDTSTQTNSDGYYFLEQIPDTIFTLIFSHPEKEKIRTSVGLNNKLDVQMTEKGITDIFQLSIEELLNLKVTTVSKSEENQSEAPGIISVLTRDDIERFGGTTLKDVLERVPGLISSTVNYTNRTTMVIRGDNTKQNSSHVLILINGRPIREIQEGGVSSDIINSFPVNIIERIEVIKGPGSVLYGSDAFTGVINVITKKAESNSLSMTHLFQNNNGFKTSLEGYVEVDDLNIVISGQYFEKPVWNTEYKRTSFTTSNDTVYNLNIKNKGPGMFVGVNYKNITINTSYNEWTTTSFPLFTDVTNKKFFTNLGYNYKINEDVTMDFNVTYTHSQFNGAPLSKRKSSNLIGEWTNVIKISPKSNLSIGGLFNYNEGTETSIQNPDSIYILANGHQSGIALYAQYDYKIRSNLKAIAATQINKIGIQNLNLVPRAGLVYHPIKQISIKALYSQAYRAPSINELYMNYLDGLFGDINLKPEKVSTIDIGIQYHGEKIQLGISAFHSMQTDIIQPVFISDTSFDRNYSNIGEVTYIGGEFESKYYINKQLYVNASMLYQTNKNDSVNNVSPIANVGAKVGFSYSSDRGIIVSLFNIYQGNLDKKFIGNINPHQGSYNILHFHSEYNLNKLFGLFNNPDIILQFNVDNLLDKKIFLYDWAGFTNDAIPVNQGRIFYLGLTIKLD